MMMYVYANNEKMSKDDMINYYSRNRMIGSGDRIRTFAVNINSETDTNYKCTFFYMKTGSKEWEYKDRLFGKRKFNQAIEYGHIIESDEKLMAKLLLLGKAIAKKKTMRETEKPLITTITGKSFTIIATNKTYKIGDTFRIDGKLYGDLTCYTHGQLSRVTPKTIYYTLYGMEFSKRVNNCYMISYYNKDFVSENQDIIDFSKIKDEWESAREWELSTR